jgi:PAS domain S-box-containing protein
MLLSNTVDFIYSFDLDGKFTYVNKAMLDILGIKLEDAIGKSFFDLGYPSDMAEKRRLQIETVIRTKSPIRDESFYTNKLGKRFYEYIFVPIMEGDIVKAIAGTSRDITHRYNLIGELKMRNEELSRINYDLDNFVYTASHDLKAPINNIHALIRFLEEDMSPDSKKNSAELLELIYSSIEKFQNTLTDLSTVVRESAGEEGQVKEVTFKEVIDDVTTNLYEVIERTEATFSFDLKESSIHFPRKNLRSIIYNLVSNAIKYRSSDRRPEIKISSERVDRYIVLKVSDNGLGIKEQDKVKVFKMFNRLHDHVEGTGVGMAIVSRIVDTSGGKIEIDSEVGKGTTFKVYFKAS